MTDPAKVRELIERLTAFVRGPAYNFQDGYEYDLIFEAATTLRDMLNEREQVAAYGAMVTGGCVCPVGAETSCGSALCPRKSFLGIVT